MTIINAGGTALAVTGNVTISNDLTITGNLIINGNTTSISANNLVVNDSLLYIANNNSGNTFDIGIVGHFVSNQYQHTGLVRDHTDGVWKLFSNVSTEPSTTSLDFTNALYDPLKVGIIQADTALINSVNLLPFTQASFNQANAAFDKANTGGVQSITANSSSRITQNGTTGAILFDLATSGVAAGTYSYPLLQVDSYGRVLSISNQTPVTSWNGQTGAVTLSSANVVSALGYTPAVDTYTQSAFNQANTAESYATSAGNYANGAFVQSNTATSYAQSAGSYANSAFSQANSAAIYANGAFIQSNTATTNAAGASLYANGAFIQANTAVNTATLSVTGTGLLNVVQANSAVNTSTVSVYNTTYTWVFPGLAPPVPCDRTNPTNQRQYRFTLRGGGTINGTFYDIVEDYDFRKRGQMLFNHHNPYRALLLLALLII